MTTDNPFLNPFKTPYEVPPFHLIKEEHYQKAFDILLEKTKGEINKIVESPESPTFENCILALENAHQLLETVTSVLYNLNAAETNEKIQNIVAEISQKSALFSSELMENVALFHKIKMLYDRKKTLGINPEQEKLLDENYHNYIRQGVHLEKDKKERIKKIKIELSKLSVEFSKKLLAANNDFQLTIKNPKDLEDIPQDVVQRAEDLAKEKNLDNTWVFTLHAPSFIPFMEYCKNRILREEMYRAYMSKCFSHKHDNRQNVLEIIRLRAELANILGYASYAQYITEKRMVKSPENVEKFLKDLLECSFSIAKQEVKEVKYYLSNGGVSHELQKWDWSFYSRKLKEEKLKLDDENLKPFFKLENVIDGVFKTAQKLYDISFKGNTTIPKYHKDVKTYEVIDSHTHEIIAVLLCDFFPRKGKREGAWMTSYRNQRKVEGKRTIPIISIVCNFTPSTEDKPSLLKFNEVKTLFHEFGHALHGMLADTTYASLSGTNVYWDFVELPSQIMENWCYEKECLSIFAYHYQNKAQIPKQLINKIEKLAVFHEAYHTVRQLSFAFLDMAWHSLSYLDACKINNVSAFERNILEKTELFPLVENINMSTQFGHIFSGGYASGYYGYKWAEVLDADAFSVFKKHGIFDKKTADLFRQTILSKGGTSHPSNLYKSFRGQKPNIEALLTRAGLNKSC